MHVLGVLSIIELKNARWNIEIILSWFYADSLDKYLHVIISQSLSMEHFHWYFELLVAAEHKIGGSDWVGWLVWLLSANNLNYYFKIMRPVELKYK